MVIIERASPLTNPTEAELLHAIAEHPHGLLDAMAAIPGAVPPRTGGDLVHDARGLADVRRGDAGRPARKHSRRRD